MYSTGGVRVKLNYNGKSITHISHPFVLCCFLLFYPPQCFLSLLCKVIFQIPKMASEEDKTTSSFSQSVLMMFKSAHKEADNNRIDTAKAAMLVSNSIEISNKSVCCCPINSPTEEV